MGSLYGDEQYTHSIKFKQKAYGGHTFEMEIETGLKLKYDYRFRRAPLHSSWRPLFLCFGMKGIEDGAYSDLTIFTAPTGDEHWSSELCVDGVLSGGIEIVFTFKDKKKFVYTSKTKYLTIDTKNPVVHFLIRKEKNEDTSTNK